MVSSTASYLAIAEDPAKPQAATTSSRRIASDTAYYLAHIGKVFAIHDFVGNTRLFSYAMKAYGLADMEYAKGLMTQVLRGGVSDTTALATTLNDPRYKAFATTFDFVGRGTGVTRSIAATTGTVMKYNAQWRDGMFDDASSDDPVAQAGPIAFAATAIGSLSLRGD